MTIQTRSKEETQAVGEEFAHEIEKGGIICIYGNLGAGKTTFAQGVAKGLGIKGNIISPTFVLIRRYELPEQRFLWHIDLYRLNDIAEIKGLGIEEIMGDTTNIVLIEWPEKIESLLPRQKWTIKLEAISENERKIEIKK